MQVGKLKTIFASKMPMPAKKTAKDQNISKRPAKKTANDQKISKRPAKKTAKDVNKPKRPPSPFFVFMEEFRKTYKEENPNNKYVYVVGKAAREKWSHMSQIEKAPYQVESDKRKNDYKKELVAYYKAMGDGSGAEEEDEDDEEEEDCVIIVS